MVLCTELITGYDDDGKIIFVQTSCDGNCSCRTLTSGPACSGYTIRALTRADVDIAYAPTHAAFKAERTLRQLMRSVLNQEPPAPDLS